MSSDAGKSRETKLLESPEALSNIVRRIAIDAGEVILDHYNGLEPLQVETKQDESPVTAADRDAEVFIKAALKNVCPNVPMIGEETVALNNADSIDDRAGYFWLVDPLDGTKNFIDGGEEFTVNIALIKNNEPCLGVVYAPVKEERYAACGPNTAIRWSAETKKDKPIPVRGLPSGGLTVITSRSYGDKSQLDNFLEQFKVNKLVKKASSLKICAIASGKADIYPRFGPTCEWDTAAGDAILRAAGGYITDTNGQALKYGVGDEKWLNPDFVAASFQWAMTEE